MTEKNSVSQGGPKKEKGKSILFFFFQTNKISQKAKEEKLSRLSNLMRIDMRDISRTVRDTALVSFSTRTGRDTKVNGTQM